MIFVDSSFWIALRDRKDANHAQAGEIVRRIMARRQSMVITDYVFAETHAYFVRSVVLRKTVMRDLLDNPVIRIEPIAPEDRENALAFLRQFDDKNWSFCDALSFAVIQRLGIRAAASFDHHFAQPGHFDLLC